MVTHQESSPIELSAEFLREMHTFQMNANITISNVTLATT